MGTVETDYFDENELYFVFYSEEISDPCPSDGLSADYKMDFYTANTIGEQRAGYDIEGITFYFEDNTNGKSYKFGYEGAVDIQSLESGNVYGRLDAYADDDYFINGNFNLVDCRE